MKKMFFLTAVIAGLDAVKAVKIETVELEEIPVSSDMAQSDTEADTDGYLRNMAGRAFGAAKSYFGRGDFDPNFGRRKELPVKTLDNVQKNAEWLTNRTRSSQAKEAMDMQHAALIGADRPPVPPHIPSVDGFGASHTGHHPIRPANDYYPAQAPQHIHHFHPPREVHHPPRTFV